MKITKTNNINKKLWRSLLSGAALGTATIILLILIISFIIEKSGKLPSGALSYITLAAAAAGAFAGGYSASRILKSSGLLVGGIVGAILFIIIFVAGLIHGGGLSLFTLYKAAALILFSMLGGVLGVNKKDKIKIR